MGILDGDLAPVVSGSFGWLMLDGTLHRRIMTGDGKGGFTTTADKVPVKGMIDAATKIMREADGFSESDVSLLILADGIGAVTLQDEITIRGGRYHILPPLSLDAAMTHWTARGRKIS